MKSGHLQPLFTSLVYSRHFTFLLFVPPLPSSHPCPLLTKFGFFSPVSRQNVTKRSSGMAGMGGGVRKWGHVGQVRVPAPHDSANVSQLPYTARGIGLLHAAQIFFCLASIFRRRRTEFHHLASRTICFHLRNAKNTYEVPPVIQTLQILLGPT